ncbi:unnamed protein product [Hyaloperonospora brassicae]|uniref:Uncharacterized protein n=1 Tax=Hyaloperonospora brassicae TaxID=162125 RepID=A0AAV0U8X6_HYABA|nr:unnamed protein product [Hyaloperonospora brassicae]
MSYLMGDDYASSSSSSSESEREGETGGVIRERNTRLRDEKEGQDEEEGVAQRLPSADYVLSAVSASTASYLPPTRSIKLHSAVQSFDLTAKARTERHQQDPEEPQPQQRGREKVEGIAGSGSNARKRPRPTERPAALQPLATRERKDAKERVKNQRVKGQAGIGADFRSWKSETEMTLRQQFD